MNHTIYEKSLLYISKVKIRLLTLQKEILGYAIENTSTFSTKIRRYIWSVDPFHLTVFFYMI
jgi:hypothetical protein